MDRKDTMIQAIETCLNKFSDFSGRAGRSEFWYFNLFVLIVDFVLGYSHIPIVENYGSFIFFIPLLAVGARRMHDIGKSGWWQIVPIANLVFFCTPAKVGE
jgi:uncharacterized membrane protein YhaH (DUF805 family)